MDRHMLKKNLFWILILTTLLVATSCATPYTPKTGTLIPGLANTLAVQTMVADPSLLQLFYTSTPIPANISLSSIGNPTPFLLTSADTPTPFTNPSQLSTLSTPVAEYTCFNSAEYIKDVTVPDGAQMRPNESFTKIWRIKNNGTCTWEEDYSIAIISGHPMGAASSKAIGQIVRPGETVDIAIDLVAPATDGIYQGYWTLQDSNGLSFSTHNNGFVSCWITIEVKKYSFSLIPGLGDKSNNKERVGDCKSGG